MLTIILQSVLQQVTAILHQMTTAGMLVAGVILLLTFIHDIATGSSNFPVTITQIQNVMLGTLNYNLSVYYASTQTMLISGSGLLGSFVSILLSPIAVISGLLSNVATGIGDILSGLPSTISTSLGDAITRILGGEFIVSLFCSLKALLSNDPNIVQSVCCGCSGN